MLEILSKFEIDELNVAYSQVIDLIVCDLYVYNEQTYGSSDFVSMVCLN